MSNNRSSATHGVCSRAGFIKLFHMTGTLTLPTSCKTWGCSVCSKKLKAFVLGKMESGTLNLGRCYLITATLKTVGGILRDAQYVRRVWTRFLRQWKIYYPSLSWFRVIESTKKGQPHLHLITGGLGEVYSHCEDFARYDKEWLSRTCDCLEHQLSSMWFASTGDSYVVDCKPVVGAKGAASYLGKYLTKALSHRQRLQELGFKRLYSTSRNWPGLDRMRLSTTLRNGWEERREFVSVGDGTAQTYRDAAAADVGSHLATRIGTPLAEFLDKRNRKQVRIAFVKGVQSASIR